VTTSHLEFRRYDGAAARELRDVVEQVYTGSYTEAIAEATATGHQFHSTAAFMTRFDSYAATEGFDLVIAYIDGQPAGQAWGWPLRPGSTWWDGLLTPVDPGFTEEDGHRTFAFSEIMVREDLTGQGLAHQLHDELLGKRPEERATLLVEPDNTTAYRAYTRWGWSKVAQLRPAWPDAPIWDVLILPLPLRNPR
jgi:ribosomal protein S18 acetylase RimI-like enzyme